MRDARQQFAWAEGIDQARARRALELVERLERDPKLFHRDLATELRSDPDDDLVDPEPDLKDMAGNPAAYSAKAVQQLVANASERAFRRFQQENRPLTEFMQQATQQQQEQAALAQGRQTAATLLSELRQEPHFKEHEREIVALYAQMGQYRERYGAVATLNRAYQKYMVEKILPTLSATERTRVVEDMQRSAVGGAQGAPQAASPQPPKRVIRDGNVDDLAARMREIAGATPVTA